MGKRFFDTARIRSAGSGADKGRRVRVPYLSLVLLGIIVSGCLAADFLADRDPSYLDLANTAHAPGREFWFGTDTLGRDMFSCIWHGGRVSLFTGVTAAAVSALIGVVYGTLSGLAPKWLDALLMRMTEIFLSVPSLLIILFLQAILGEANVLSLSFVIGVTSWCGIASVIRTEVRQIRNSEYIVASKCMGGGFFHILRWHLAPGFVSPLMFMVVMNIRTAIMAESTLSFMGVGLPLDVISWGSMLSLAESAWLTRAWWMIWIPGVFLVVSLMCMTDIGSWMREGVNHRERNL